MQQTTLRAQLEDMTKWLEGRGTAYGYLFDQAFMENSEPSLLPEVQSSWKCTFNFGLSLKKALIGTIPGSRLFGIRKNLSLKPAIKLLWVVVWLRTINNMEGLPIDGVQGKEGRTNLRAV